MKNDSEVSLLTLFDASIDAALIQKAKQRKEDKDNYVNIKMHLIETIPNDSHWYFDDKTFECSNRKNTSCLLRYLEQIDLLVDSNQEFELYDDFFHLNQCYFCSIEIQSPLDHYPLED